MSSLIPTLADEKIYECIDSGRSFAVIAGAGSGKTTSLIGALDRVRSKDGSRMRQSGQRVVCLTYTNRAVDVVTTRLAHDDLFVVATLHSFFWSQIGSLHRDTREMLELFRIPALIAKAREKYTGRDTKESIKAGETIERLELEVAAVRDVKEFVYTDSIHSDYPNGLLNHDDVVEIARYLLIHRPLFRRMVALRFPYIFVDEAQDTYEGIVEGLNLVSGQDKLPIIGYYGDPWQQIYDGRAGDFAAPPNGLLITKPENYRSAPQIIDLLNAFRTDVQQVPAGSNRELEGSVRFCLVKAEAPGGARRRYTSEQLDRSLLAMDQAIEMWGWSEGVDFKRLFLARQMIARRLGFSELHELFTGSYASARSQDNYERGEHYLLKPFVKLICPLIAANQVADNLTILSILRDYSPAYKATGPNSERTLQAVLNESKSHLSNLIEIYRNGSVKDVLSFCVNIDLIEVSDHLRDQLTREARHEEYDPDLHAEDKGDWLADRFLNMHTSELAHYAAFVLENTPYSTQHGVKGEEYPNVMVVYDDVEAQWSLYSFTKLFTPQTSGQPTEGQRERGRKLAYVSFSRAINNLRILLYTENPESARRELIDSLRLNNDQVSILNRQ